LRKMRNRIRVRNSVIMTTPLPRGQAPMQSRRSVDPTWPVPPQAAFGRPSSDDRTSPCDYSLSSPNPNGSIPCTPGDRAPDKEILGQSAIRLSTTAESAGRGCWVAHFPCCPKCRSYALHRPVNAGLYECLTCRFEGIEERDARIESFLKDFKAPQRSV
jgi:hypothetical protein